MDSVRDIAKSIIAEMAQLGIAPMLPPDAKHYRRLAIITYADALRNAAIRSEKMNAYYIQQAHEYAEKAIASGLSEDRIEHSFALLRAYWLPRLGRRGHVLAEEKADHAD